jgi:hypothetical protein
MYAGLGAFAAACSDGARLADRRPSDESEAVRADAAGPRVDRERADATDTRDAASAPSADLDGDGLDDLEEARLARSFLPFLALRDDDACKLHGIIFRLTPSAGERVMIWYDVLYERDCGLNGHAGDNEGIGVLADRRRPGPAGILAVRAISHQGTPCEAVTTCGACGGLPECARGARAGLEYPVVFHSKNKHGGFTDKARCDRSIVCDFGGCALPSAAPDSPLVNVGEPARPLVRNLTAQGFITEANGWRDRALFNFDPWKPGKFGGAGDVSQDLVDSSFVPVCP